MKTTKNILIAFILNLAFAIFEFFGGAITGSVAIMSDAVHDIGDATSIGISYFLERISKKGPDAEFTYGYGRYSVVGSFITTLILLVGSIMVIVNAIGRIFNPVEIHYDGMIIFAVFGVITNLIAAWVTKDGESLNQKAVNLHMLEDVLGWVVVLIGGIVMRFTDIAIVDPLMSIGVALFILTHAIKNLKGVVDLFLERIPKGIHLEEIKQCILSVPDVQDVHHIHLWSLDGVHHSATMHIVTEKDFKSVKCDIRQKLKGFGIFHATLELETPGEECSQECCHVAELSHGHHHHHHHHHH